MSLLLLPFCLFLSLPAGPSAAVQLPDSPTSTVGGGRAVVPASAADCDADQGRPEFHQETCTSIVPAGSL